MKLTMEQYITNPMQSPILTAVMRESMRNSYIKKFNQILLREHGFLNYQLYKDEDNNKYYAYIKVPSETVQRFYYDTIIEFSADQYTKEAGKNLFKYNVRFWSNDPSFVYTYVYTFNRRGLLITEFSSKMSQRALRDKPVEKNPTEMVGYVKTIYFAYLFMRLRSFNDIDKFKAQASVVNLGNLEATIMPADQKLGERETAGERLAKKNKAQKEKERREANKTHNKALPDSMKVNNTGTVKVTKASTGSKFSPGNVKKSKVITGKAKRK